MSENLNRAIEQHLHEMLERSYGAGVVKITPAMERAGAAILEDLFDVGPLSAGGFAKQIYAAMAMASDEP